MLFASFLLVQFLSTFASAQMMSWSEYKAAYNKNYASPLEDLEHKNIFMNSVKSIMEFNSKPNSYEQGINMFSDMTFAEFSSYLGKNPVNSSKLEYFESSTKQSVPDSLDWRSKGGVTPVRNQQSCGSCWAFSAIASLEGVLFVKTKKLVEMSDQHLVDCDGTNGGCDGGDQAKTYTWLSKNGGPVKRSCYEYTGKKSSCKKINDNCRVAKISGFKRTRNEKDLKVAIAQIGPIAVSVEVNRNFQRYRSGIFNDPKCTKRGINHAVTAVGYGSEGDKAYWIIKNSWGDWGEKGYMRLAKDKNDMCGVGSDTSYAVGVEGGEGGGDDDDNNGGDDEE